MKNIYTFCESKTGDPEKPEGEEFIVKRLDPELAAKHEALRKEAERLAENATLPKWLQYVTLGFLLVGMALFLGALEALTDSEVEYEVMVKNGVWWFFGAGAALLAVGGALMVFSVIRRKSVMSDSAYRDFDERNARHMVAARENLLVPAEAFPIDVFCERYTFLFKHRMKMNVCQENYVFRDGTALCLAGAEYVVRIPWDKIERVERVERKIAFVNWNKPEPAKSFVYYKVYKVRENQNGQYYVKPYYRIVPSYDYDKLVPLLGSSGEAYVTVKK